jgi:hypothetical protein
MTFWAFNHELFLLQKDPSVFLDIFMKNAPSLVLAAHSETPMAIEISNHLAKMLTLFYHLLGKITNNIIKNIESLNHKIVQIKSPDYSGLCF